MSNVVATCLVCEGPIHEDTIQLWQLPGCEIAVVCSGCADVIANAYNMRCGGRWLTWSNPPSAKPAKAKIPRTLAKRVFERDAYRCVACASHLDLTCDHVIPESKGGPTTFENLQTMCRPCNCRKGATL